MNDVKDKEITNEIFNVRKASKRGRIQKRKKK